MLIVRDIMYCKPGKVRPMVEKFQAMRRLGEKMGFGSMRIMTDVCAERYWTIVVEIEVESVDAFAETSQKAMQNKDFQEVMKGYHDLVDSGRREVYTLEK
jgi:hypothetical protein